MLHGLNMSLTFYWNCYCCPKFGRHKKKNCTCCFRIWGVFVYQGNLPATLRNQPYNVSFPSAIRHRPKYSPRLIRWLVSVTCIDLSKVVSAIDCEQVVSSSRATRSKRRTIERIEGSPDGERSTRVFALLG